MKHIFTSLCFILLFSQTSFGQYLPKSFSKPLIQYEWYNHTDNNEWRIASTTDFHWNSTYEEVLTIDIDYGENNNVPNVREYTHIYTNGKVTEELIRSTIFPAGTIEDYERKTFTYDAICDKASKVQVERRWQNAWIPDYDYDYTFNDSCLISERLYTVYNVNGNIDLETRKVYHYNTANKVDSILTYYKTNSGGWELHFRLLYLKNIYGKDSLFIDYRQLIGTNTLVPHYQCTYTYNGGQQLISSIFYDSNLDSVNLQWTPTEQAFYTYENSLVTRKTTYRWNTTLASWEEYKQRYYEYDLEKDIVQDSSYLWDGNAYTIRNNRYNWYYAFPTSTQPVLEQTSVLCAFPNPYQIGTPIRCEALNANETYTMKLFNLLGQLQEVQQFSGSRGAFSITNPNLITGVYFMTIEAKGQLVESKKILVKRSY